MPSASDPAELLAALSAALARVGCRWYLFGAQAVTIWGRPRLTADVDVTVEIAAGTTEQFVATLTSAGFHLAEEFSDEFVRVTRVIPFLRVATGMHLDVVLAGPGLEEQFLQRARLVDIAGIQVPVISPEDLVITKALAGRVKDLEDIRGIILAQTPSLDVEYVRRALTLLEEGLGQSDLVATFESQLRRVTERKPPNA